MMTSSHCVSVLPHSSRIGNGEVMGSMGCGGGAYTQLTEVITLLIVAKTRV